MKTAKIINLFLFSITLICVLSCSNSNQDTVTKTTKDPSEKHLTVVDKNLQTIEIKLSAFALDKDPLCGTKMDGSFKDTTMYKGKMYAFCCGGCKAAFLNNPDYILANKLW